MPTSSPFPPSASTILETLVFEKFLEQKNKLEHVFEKDSILRLFVVKPKSSINLHTTSVKVVYVWEYSPENAISLAFHQELADSWLSNSLQPLSIKDFIAYEVTPPSNAKIEVAATEIIHLV